MGVCWLRRRNRDNWPESILKSLPSCIYVLGRDMDRSGYFTYASLIEEGQLNLDAVENILMESEEFRARQARLKKESGIKQRMRASDPKDPDALSKQTGRKS